jgi:hypothetical protein
MSEVALPEAWCLRSAFHDRLTKEPNGQGFSGWRRMPTVSKLSASGLHGCGSAPESHRLAPLPIGYLEPWHVEPIGVKRVQPVTP